MFFISLFILMNMVIFLCYRCKFYERNGIIGTYLEINESKSSIFLRKMYYHFNEMTDKTDFYSINWIIQREPIYKCDTNELLKK